MSEEIKGLPRIPRKIPPTVEATDIVKMICKRCGQAYTRRSGLMIDGKLTQTHGTLIVKPCVGMPIGRQLNSVPDPETLTQAQMDAIEHQLAGDGKCGSTEYLIYREMKVNAMPIGRVYNDLSRKHS